MRRRAVATALATALAIAAGVGGGTVAAFSGTTETAANTFTAAPDWTAPAVSGSLVAKTAGGIPAFIKQGGTYHVYANATDSGNPASGVSTVTANVSSFDSGQTAVPLTATPCPCVIGSIMYLYRSASLTADNPLAAGSKAYTVTATDAASNGATQPGFTVAVDNTVPAAADIQTANVSGGTLGRAEAGDTVTYTYSEAIDPGTISAGWDGTALLVIFRLNQAAGSDTFQVFNAAGTTQLPVGTVSLGRPDYTTTTRIFLASTMVRNGSQITVTLGTASGATGTANANATMSWTPSNVPTDAAGNACSTAPGTETGAADKDF